MLHRDSWYCVFEYLPDAEIHNLYETFPEDNTLLFNMITASIEQVVLNRLIHRIRDDPLRVLGEIIYCNRCKHKFIPCDNCGVLTCDCGEFCRWTCQGHMQSCEHRDLSYCNTCAHSCSTCRAPFGNYLSMPCCAIKCPCGRISCYMHADNCWICGNKYCYTCIDYDHICLGCKK